MTDMSELSRRERQILEILFEQEEATVLEIQDRLPNAPTDMAIRRLLAILEDKGHVRRRKQGRGHVYRPRVTKQRAAKNALRGVLDTFFGGDVDQALAMHLADRKADISEEQFDQMLRLIHEARQERG